MNKSLKEVDDLKYQKIEGEWDDKGKKKLFQENNVEDNGLISYIT